MRNLSDSVKTLIAIGAAALMYCIVMMLHSPDAAPSQPAPLPEWDQIETCMYDCTRDTETERTPCPGEDSEGYDLIETYADGSFRCEIRDVRNV